MSYPLTFPSVGIRASSFRLRRAVSSSTSPFTLNQQVYKHQGARWEGEVTFIPMRRSSAALVQSFLAALDGQYGTFLYGDPDAIALGKLGAGGGTPLVNGSSQTGNTLTIDGCSALVNGWLKAGDYFSLGSGTGTQIYMMTQDANTDSGGNATLNFEPSLRSSPADNAAVEITSPKGLFRLADNKAEWQADYANLHTISIAFIEAIVS